LYKWEKKESDKLSIEKEPNESEKVFYTFKEYLNEIKNIE
jgi:hypothetical protein